MIDYWASAIATQIITMQLQSKAKQQLSTSTTAQQNKTSAIPPQQQADSSKHIIKLVATRLNVWGHKLIMDSNLQ